MTRPSGSAARSRAEAAGRGLWAALLVAKGELRPGVVPVLAALSGILVFVLALELALVLLSLSGVQVLEYLVGAPFLVRIAQGLSP